MYADKLHRKVGRIAQRVRKESLEDGVQGGRASCVWIQFHVSSLMDVIYAVQWGMDNNLSREREVVEDDGGKHDPMN